MKLRDRDADAPGRRQRPGARQDRADAGRRPAHRRAGAQHRSRRRRARAARLRRAVAGAARRRLGPAAQQGDDRRQPAAAHALPLFLRHRPALQQARARQRLLGASAASAASTRSSARSEACIATHPSDMAVAMRALDADGRDRAAGRRDAQHPDRRLPPPARRHAAHRDRRWSRGELITAVTLPQAGRRHAHLPQGARPRVLRLRAGLGRRRSCSPTARGRVALGGVAHKPWRVEAAEAELPRGAKAVTARLLAGAKPTHDNAFKLPLVERTLAAVLAEARG